MLSAIESFHHPSYIEINFRYRQPRIDYIKAALWTAAALGYDYIAIEPAVPSPMKNHPSRRLRWSSKA